MIILTCRNNLELSKRCLQTLLAQTVKAPVLVVDNASNDGTAHWLRATMWTESERLAAMTYPEPVSVAEMWNRALDFAWSRWAGRALVVNNDTELLPNTYEFLQGALLATPISRQVGMVTCVSVRERERLVMPESEVGMRPHPDYSCFMLARWAHKMVRFDERYEGAFGEDCDHHVRLHRAGVQAMNLGLPFLHHGSMTVKTADTGERQRIERNAGRNRERFFGEYGCYPGTKGYERLFG